MSVSDKTVYSVCSRLTLMVMKLTGLERGISVNQYFDRAADKSLLQRLIEDNKDLSTPFSALDKSNKDCKTELIEYLNNEIRAYAASEIKENYAALKNGNLLVVKTLNSVMQKHA
ncbi:MULTISPECIES: hypothetical protein [Morganella]|uniref:hypothetical protein n=1 Tax=Morganella TaxID=581 RepID=UPI001C48936F|nr:MULTISPECIES: hypothetical protein [Morganella]QXO71329.1 hypothetical protein JC793_10705 [Morganella morganii]